MKKKATWIFTLLIMAVVCVIGTAKETAAKETDDLTWIAYVNEEKNPVLRLSAEKAIKYTIKCGDDTVASSDGKYTEKERLFKFDLVMKQDKKYTLTVSYVEDEKTNKFTVDYKLGKKVVPAKLTTSGQGITVNITRSDTTQWIPYVYNEKSIFVGSTSSGKESNVDLKKTKAGNVNAMAVAITTTKNGKVYYGYGDYGNVGKNYDYVPQIELKAYSQINQILLKWDDLADHYKISFKKKGDSKFSELLQTSDTSLEFTKKVYKKIKAGDTYVFKITAYDGGKAGVTSKEESAKVYSSLGKVKKPSFTVDDHGELYMKWSKVSNATSYVVYSKSSSKEKLLGTTKKCYFYLNEINQNKKIKLVVYPQLNGTTSNKASEAVSIIPEKWLKANRLEILAKKVKGIKYKKGKCVINTSISYTNEIIEAYCNYFTSHKSKTKWLLFVSLYTQQGAILTGKQGHWKIYKDLTIYDKKLKTNAITEGRFDCSGGSYENRTRRGLNEVFLKEKAWVHPSTTSWFITHFWNKASFHSYPCWNKGGYQDARIRQPVSTACVRVSYDLAKWIYDNIPLKTLVRVK